MAESLHSAAKRLPVAGLVAVAVATAMGTFLVAIMMPPFILGASIASLIFAVKLRRERDPSAPLMGAVAAGCLVATVIYAALAIANAQFESSGGGTQTVPAKVVTVR